MQRSCSGGGEPSEELPSSRVPAVEEGGAAWLQEAGEEETGGEDANAQFHKYCDAMAGPAVWGGQAELSALAHVVQRSIQVFSVGMPPVSMGEEYAGAPPLLHTDEQGSCTELIASVHPGRRVNQLHPHIFPGPVTPAGPGPAGHRMVHASHHLLHQQCY